MYGMPVLCQVEDHATQEKITVDRQEVWDEFVAHHLKTKRDEPLRIYLLLANSKFSNGQSVATHPGSFGDALELGPKYVLMRCRGRRDRATVVCLTSLPRVNAGAWSSRSCVASAFSSTVSALLCFVQGVLPRALTRMISLRLCRSQAHVRRVRLLQGEGQAGD